MKRLILPAAILALLAAVFWLGRIMTIGGEPDPRVPEVQRKPQFKFYADHRAPNRCAACGRFYETDLTDCPNPKCKGE